MKRAIFTTLVVAASVVLATPCYGEIVEGSKSKFDTLSYNIGANFGGTLKQQLGEIDIDSEKITSGIVEVVGGKAKLSSEEAIITIKSFFGEVLKTRMAKHQEVLNKKPKAVFKAFKNKGERGLISYAVGVDIGTNIAKSRLPIQYTWLVEGIEDAWKGKAKFTEEQLMSYLNHYFMVIVPAENAARSAKWLETVKNSADVKATESGLLYKVVVEGDMTRAAKSDDDIVKVHYVGRLQDGTVFDASRFEQWSKERQDMVREHQPNLFDSQGRYIQNKPVEFPLNRVISGWTEGMKLIGPGGKIVLYIPAELAYGNRGAGNDIGPNEALEFEVELIDVTPATK